MNKKLSAKVKSKKFSHLTKRNLKKIRINKMKWRIKVILGKEIKWDSMNNVN